MIAPRWWFDLRQYRRHLQHYSDEELVDVYFHIHPLQYQEHYLCVLQELRRRGIRPQIAERPLPDVGWNMLQWLQRWAWLRRSALRLQMAMGLTTLLLSAVLTAVGLLPVGGLIRLMGVYSTLDALGYFVLIVGAWMFGLGATWRAGARGWLFPLALIGASTLALGFTHSQPFEQLWFALKTPPSAPSWSFSSGYW